MITSIGGLKVYVQPDSPKMQLSESIKEVLSPDFVTEINAWMVDFFGVTNLIPDGQFLFSEKFGFTTMNPRTYARFLAEVNVLKQEKGGVQK